MAHPQVFALLPPNKTENPMPYTLGEVCLAAHFLFSFEDKARSSFESEQPQRKNTRF